VTSIAALCSLNQLQHTQSGDTGVALWPGSRGNSSIIAIFAPAFGVPVQVDEFWGLNICGSGVEYDPTMLQRNDYSDPTNDPNGDIVAVKMQKEIP